MTEPMVVRLRAVAPVADVWRALTDAAELRTWLAEHAEAELPHRYEFWGRDVPAGDRPRQHVTEAADGVLEFGWAVAGLDTTVRIELAEQAGETVITLSHQGLPGWQEMMDAGGVVGQLQTFWALAMANLVDRLEGREPVARCDLTSPEMRAVVDIAASPQDVFDSLVDPDVFARWFGARMEVELEIGGRWAMGGFDIDPQPARILELDPGHKLSLGWDSGMVATWDLAESDGKTRLTFVQSGFDETDPPYDAWMGWLSGFAELRRFHTVPGWRQTWLDVQMDGMPEDMITLD